MHQLAGGNFLTLLTVGERTELKKSVAPQSLSGFLLRLPKPTSPTESGKLENNLTFFYYV